MNNIVLEKMLTIDETGMPKVPNIRQLQDKDVLMLYTRDGSKDKRKYIAEVGVIYYLGDPKSPAKQQGLSYEESLKMAIENYNLPKDYVPDILVKRLIDKYYVSNITDKLDLISNFAGIVLLGSMVELPLETLDKIINVNLLATYKINNLFFPLVEND